MKRSWLFQRTLISRFTRFICMSVVVVVTAVSLSSCGSHFFRRYHDDYSVDSLRYDTSNAIRNDLVGSCLDASGNVTGSPKDGKVICDYCLDGRQLNSEQKAQCSYQRDLVIGDLIGISDGLCETHIKTIYGNEAVFNIVTGTFTNAFSGAATVVGGEGSKSILSALAFFFNSERSLINETVYKSVVVPAIVKKINDSRKTLRKGIQKKFEESRKGQYENYPTTIALLDVTEYHQSCSFMHGLQRALDEGVQNTKERDLAFLEQKRSLLTLQYDARLNELKRQMDDKKITPEMISDDPLAKGLRAQIEALNDQIAAFQKLEALPSLTPKSVEEKTLSGKVVDVSENAKTIRVAVPGAPEVEFDVSGVANASGIKPSDSVAVRYTIQDGRNIARIVDIKRQPVGP